MMKNDFTGQSEREGQREGKLIIIYSQNKCPFILMIIAWVINIRYAIAVCTLHPSDVAYGLVLFVFIIMSHVGCYRAHGRLCA